jgi:hypothetical protein
VRRRGAASGQRGEQDGDASGGEQPRAPVATRAAKGTMWLQQVPAIFLMFPENFEDAWGVCGANEILCPVF